MLAPHLRRAGRGLIVTCALALGLAGTARADAQYRFWHFNMCGSACNGGAVQELSDAVRGSIETYKPHGVSLNEACESQFATTHWNLNARAIWSVHGAWVATKTTDNACDSDRFGNGLFSRTPILMGASATSLPKTQSTAETRKLWCAVVDLPRDTVFCTVHITNHEPDQDAQIRTVADTVNQWVDSGTPVVLMGDFNVAPTDPKLDRIYHSLVGRNGFGRFEEVDQHNTGTTCRCGESTLGTAKIDYIFVSARDFRTVDGDATSSSFSDHDPLRGSAYLIF